MSGDVNFFHFGRKKRGHPDTYQTTGGLRRRPRGVVRRGERGRSGESPDAPWAPWWLWLWGIVAVGLIALIFIVPFKWWAVAAVVGFGPMEGYGLVHPHDPYPPLTHVIRRYVPRWAAFTAIYGFTGAAGGFWFGFARPEHLGFLFALLGWFTSHFDVTFDEGTEAVERAKHRRILKGALRVISPRRS